jgi:hypothetical protein
MLLWSCYECECFAFEMQITLGYFTVQYVPCEPVLFRENGICEAMNLQAIGTRSQVFEFVDCV